MQCKQSKNEHILRLDEDDIRWDEGTIGFAAAPSWDPPASSTTTTLYPVAGASFLEWSPPAMAVAASGIENRGRTKKSRDTLSDVWAMWLDVEVATSPVRPTQKPSRPCLAASVTCWLTLHCCRRMDTWRTSKWGCSELRLQPSCRKFFPLFLSLAPHCFRYMIIYQRPSHHFHIHDRV